MNRGFGPGAPRNDKYKALREGREKGGFLPKVRGVGRIGNRAVGVPEQLVRAVKEGLRIEEKDEE